MIISSQHYFAKKESEKLTALACILAALLEAKDIFSADQGRLDCDISHRVSKLILAFNKPYGALVNIVKQIKSLAKRASLNNINSLITHDLSLENLGLLLAFAYPERVAKARGSVGDYVCANGKGVTIDEQDALASEPFLIIADLMQYQHVLRVRLAARIELAQIEELFQDHILEQEIAVFDEKSGKIIAREQTKLASIILQETVSNTALSSDTIAAMWSELVTRKGLSMLNWQTKDLALKARWQWLTRYFPEYELPEVEDKTLIANLKNWFTPFVGEIKSLAKLTKLDLSAMLLSQLDYQQQQLLKQAAPSIYIGPTGRHCPITYSAEKSPKVSMPMQELYGETQTPKVGGINGQHGISLLLELLSPAQRPIQVTQDLIQFWQGSYKAVQKDMKSRYPKHYWPDDPANAQPTNKTKRYIKTHT